VLTLTTAIALAILSPLSGCAARTSSKSGDVDTSPELLWKADMEEGTLADWYSPLPGPSGDYGGGEYNSGNADATPSAKRSHEGAYSVRMALPSGKGGTRLFRWRELHANRETIVSAWFYFPRAYRPTARGRYLNLFQFKSRSPSGPVDPLLWLNVNRSMRLELIWWHRTLEGPRRGQAGFRRLPQHVAALPLHRWFEVEARLRQSKEFDGRLRVWQDQRLLFDLRGIRTSYANCSFNSWCASNEWAINNYSDGTSPTPTVIYADDVRIERP
jgi:hypothetical protein